MKLNRVGFIGWRGMVGSVLLQRMREEDDFAHLDAPLFFTTSAVGRQGPNIGREIPPLADAHDLDALAAMDAIVCCQGGDYTTAIHPKLRAHGWRGYWIDAASPLRLTDDAAIILDPVNLPLIERRLADGTRDFIGGNCTVSLMLMALAGLFHAGLIEWVTVMTYQAISGGGARQMRELLAQMGYAHQAAAALLAEPTSAILDIDHQVITALRADELPVADIGAPLAGSLLPWVDADSASGVSREEHKGAVETHKILGGNGTPIPIESTCVRVSTLRCHSQAFTIKLTRDVPVDELNERIAGAHRWATLVPNRRADTLARLTPVAVSGSLDIAVGRLRKLALGGGNGGGGGDDDDGGDGGNDAAGYLSAFTVGDQLLWGAAEPLRRMLHILRRH